MKRKVVKLGPSTLVVSLPNKWTKKQNVQAGDEIELKEEKEGLLISTENIPEIQRKTLDLTQKETLLKRILASHYLLGADEVEVKVNTREKAKIIQRRVDEMIGMEIIEQEKERLVISDIGGTKKTRCPEHHKTAFFSTQCYE